MRPDLQPPEDDLSCYQVQTEFTCPRCGYTVITEEEAVPLQSFAAPLGFKAMISAQILAGYSLASMAIAIVIVAALAALVFIALRQFGIAIPPWVVQVFWVLVVAFIVIFAIRLLMSM